MDAALADVKHRPRSNQDPILRESLQMFNNEMSNHFMPAEEPEQKDSFAELMAAQPDGLLEFLMPKSQGELSFRLLSEAFSFQEMQ